MEFDVTKRADTYLLQNKQRTFCLKFASPQELGSVIAEYRRIYHADEISLQYGSLQSTDRVSLESALTSTCAPEKKLDEFTTYMNLLLGRINMHSIMRTALSKGAIDATKDEDGKSLVMGFPLYPEDPN